MFAWEFKNCLRILIMSWLFKDPINSGQARFDHAQSNSKKLPQIIFFLKKQLINFPCTYWPLSFSKILRKFLGPIQSYENVLFSGPFIMNKIFLVQTIIITFIYLLALFIAQNLKKLLQRIQSYEDALFLGSKWSICSKQKFLENY